MENSKLKSKPKCKLVGTDGNIFALAGKVSQTLKKAGLKEEAKKMTNEVFACKSYEDALCTLGTYVDIR
jgi:hypothetical protein